MTVELRANGKATSLRLALLALALSAAACGQEASGFTAPAAGSPASNAAPSKIAPRGADVSYLYVAYDGNPQNAQVDVMRRNDLRQGVVRKIRKHVQYPDGIFVDSADTLYVANGIDSGGHDTVTVYKAGAREPFRTYRGFCYAGDVLVGPDGTVYIADGCGTTESPRARGENCIDNGAVHVFAPNSTKQIRVLRFKGGPVSLTLDNDNDLYVGYENACGDKGQVRRYPAGGSKGVDLLPPKTIFSIGGIALDTRGNLLAVDKGRGAIDVFSAEHEPPSRIIGTGQTYSYRLAFDERENRLYVTFPYLPDVRRDPNERRDAGSGPKRANTLVVIDYASGKLLYTLRRIVPGWVPSGVAVFPAAPFGHKF